MTNLSWVIPTSGVAGTDDVALMVSINLASMAFHRGILCSGKRQAPGKETPNQLHFAQNAIEEFSAKKSSFG